MFEDPVERGQALCVPLFYGLMEGIVLSIYCIIGWKIGWTKAPKSEKICVVIATTYEVEDDENDNELVGRHRDEERQQECDSPGIDTERGVAPDAWPDVTRPEHKAWSLFRKRKHTMGEESEIAAASSPGRASLSQSINDGLVDSIAQMDAITDLVQFPQKVEYARCRVNSEEGIAITAASNAPTSSIANSSPTVPPRPVSLMK